mgnify:CR=1 FL=1
MPQHNIDNFHEYFFHCLELTALTSQAEHTAYNVSACTNYHTSTHNNNNNMIIYNNNNHLM